MAKLNKKADGDKKPEKVAAVKTDKPKGRKQQTVRERTKTSDSGRKRRLRTTAGKVSSPFRRFKQFRADRGEYHMPLPDNRIGRILGKRVHVMPKFLREAGHEIRLVTWPNARETIRLTIAVFIFAVIFATIVGALDYVIGEIFREVIIN